MSVSFSLTVTVLRLLFTEGIVFGNGATSKFDCTSCSSMYSSKLKVILFPVKLSCSLAGLALTINGAVVSFGPPVGIPIWAQPPLKSVNTEAIKNNKQPARIFLFIRF
ncbi:MAG: hypothetical protein BWY67_02081 [Bacteroidetes bacterium ADurb.Bin397]|nr:MAG: hypothetical protein BWY67_02081 [Bacteroidetes bacterium ADurb.Bin397]